jgi:hypothetical protein
MPISMNGYTECHQADTSNFARCESANTGMQGPCLAGYTVFFLAVLLLAVPARRFGFIGTR